MDASPLPAGSRPLENERVEAWLADARGGSRSALGRALEASRAYLTLVAARTLDDKLRSKLGASDLVQDTFAEAQRGFAAFRGATCEEFHGWLVGILAHRLAHSVRRFRQTQGRDVDRELPADVVEAALAAVRDAAPTPGADAIAREEQRRVQAALARLESEMRDVLVERMWQDATFAAIGGRRGMSAAAACKLWARAVRAMHQALLDVE